MQQTDRSHPDAMRRAALPVVLRIGDVPALDPQGHRFRVLTDLPVGGWCDVAVVRPRLAETALLDRLVNDEVPLVLLTGPEDADAAGLALSGAVRAILPEAPEETEFLAALLEALAPGDGVRERGTWLDPRIAALKEEAQRVAAAVAALAEERSAPDARGIDAARIRAHIRARRLRERYFAASLFADPAWDILLDLAAARLEGRLVSVSSLCIAAAVPTTTALRWIKNLLDLGMLDRSADPADARRAFIALSPATARTMDRCLEAVLNAPGL